MSVVQTDVLRRILSAAQSGARRYACHAQPQPLQLIPAAPTTTNLLLPLPEPLTSRLIDMGIDEPSSERISSTVMRIVQLFKDKLDADFHGRCQALKTQASCLQDVQFLLVLSSNYCAVFSKAVRDWTSYVLDDFTPRLLRARQFRQDCLKSPHRSQKRPFNHSAVPALERSFEQNAFPSRLEKYELASKYDMTYRQVDVWFQNHRTRFRKEGKELRQSNPRNALAEELERSVVDKLLPVDPQEEVHTGTHGDVDEEPSTLSSAEASSGCFGFRLTPPRHAFPSPYPPLCAYDPFPTAPEKRTLELPWLRSPQSQTSTADVPITVEQLAISLTKLTIADDVSPSSSPKSNTPPRQQPMTIGFTTPCCRAPLPSLVHQRSRRSPMSCPPESALCALNAGTPCQTHPHAEHTPQANLPANSQGGTALAPLFSISSLSRPKKRGLPRRVPRRPPLHHPASFPTTQPAFAATPPFPFASSSASSSFASSSSFSASSSYFSSASFSAPSISSSSPLPLSRAASMSSPRSTFSSSTSDVDSPLSTPKLLPMASSSQDAIVILTEIDDQVWLGDRPELQPHNFFPPTELALGPLNDCFMHKPSLDANAVSDSFAIA